MLLMPRSRSPSKQDRPDLKEGASSVSPRDAKAPGRAPLSLEEERQALMTTLQRMGFSPAARHALSPWGEADLWVRRAGGRSVFPVLVEPGTPTSTEDRTRQLLERWSHGLRTDPSVGAGTSSILVVDSDASAELAGRRIVSDPPVPLSLAVSRTRILVHPRRAGEDAPAPHWHRLRLPPRVVLMLATGALVGIAERSQRSGGDEGGTALGGVNAEEGAIPIDLEGMLRALRNTFSVDIEGSLGVTREEDAMFLLYQLALKETYAPGDQGASLHELVNNPKGPAARLPWFAI